MQFVCICIRSVEIKYLHEHACINCRHFVMNGTMWQWHGAERHGARPKNHLSNNRLWIFIEFGDCCKPNSAINIQREVVWASYSRLAIMRKPARVRHVLVCALCTHTHRRLTMLLATLKHKTNRDEFCWFTSRRGIADAHSIAIVIVSESRKSHLNRSKTCAFSCDFYFLPARYDWNQLGCHLTTGRHNTHNTSNLSRSRL